MKPYYEHEGITIYLGDCREVLPALEFDAVLTDPPYGVSGKQNTKTRGRGPKNAYTKFVDSVDYVLDVAVPVIDAVVASGRRCVITPGCRCLTLYPKPDAFGAIYQPASVGLQPWGRADAQPILYYGKSPHAGRGLPSQRCSFQQVGSRPDPGVKGHPCPKPLALWVQLLLCCTLEGETVCDPFMGSGTTLRAAKDNGRRAIGIEIEEQYCEIAAKRLGQAVLPFAPVAP